MSDGLRDIHIKGFASLADVRLEPGRLSVLIGPNGSGKSNILRALRMVPLMRTGSLQRFVAEAGGAAALLHYGPKRAQALSVTLDFAQGERRHVYEARLGFAAGDRLMYLDESVGYQPTSDAELRTTSLGAGHWESELRQAKASDATARTVNYWLSQMTFFHFHDTSMTSALRTYARAEDDRLLRSDGSACTRQRSACWPSSLAQCRDIRRCSSPPSPPPSSITSSLPRSSSSSVNMAPALYNAWIKPRSPRGWRTIACRRSSTKASSEVVLDTLDRRRGRPN